MGHLTYEALRRNPDLLDQLLRDARRERAAAVDRLISAALRALLARPRRAAPRPSLQAAACG